MATLLAITVLLPLAGSLFLIVRPRLEKEAARNIALGSGLPGPAGKPTASAIRP